MLAAIVTALFAAPFLFFSPSPFHSLPHLTLSLFLSLTQSICVMLFSHVEPLGPPVASRSLCSFARRFRCISKQVPGRRFSNSPDSKFYIQRRARIQVNKHSTPQKLGSLRIETCKGPNTYEGQTCLNEIRSGFSIIFSNLIINLSSVIISFSFKSSNTYLT